MSEAAINESPKDESQLPIAAPAIAPQALTLGARLTAERESKEWSIEQVAAQLNLAPRQIYALEKDDYAALPGMASVRGFVRAYAKLLKTDAAPLVAMIASEQTTPTVLLTPRRSLPPTPFSDNRLMSSRRRRASSKTILLTFLAVVLIIIVAVAVERMGWPALAQSLASQIKELNAVSPIAQNDPPAAIVSGAPSVAPAAIVSAPEFAVVSKEAASIAMGGYDGVGATGSAAAAISNPESTMPEQPKQGLTIAETNEPSATKSGADAKNLLVLTLHEDSWVEVRAGRSALISRLLKAGSTKSLEITEPVALTLGNAAGVEATLRGSPLEIKATAKNNVVRLSLK